MHTKVRLQCQQNNSRVCLAGLTEELLERALDKRNDIRCSNWEQCPLTAAQQAYAATDAYAALKLFQVGCACTYRICIL